MIVDINSLTYDSFICGVKCDTNIKNTARRREAGAAAL